MGQCAALDRAHDACSGAEDNFPCTGRSTRRSGADAPVAVPRDVAGELRAGLQAFRERGAAGLRASGHAVLAELPWDAASNFVEGLVSGLHAHLPGAVRHVEVGEGSPDGQAELVSIAVYFARAPLVGEFATRSRQPVEIRVGERLCFALARPARRGDVVPLVLKASGLQLHALPEIVELRTRLLALMGHGEHLNWKTVGHWWVINKEKEYSLETSKLRRVCDSFQEVVSLPKMFQAKAFWGYMHAVSRSLDAFEFRLDDKAGVTVTGESRVLHAADEDLAAVSSELCHEMLRVHRSLAEKFAASTVNMGAFFEGLAVGQPGANPAKLTKLFSAASHWGPGDRGWYRHDDTWTCVDRTDRFGRVVEEQGRTIWHFGDVARKQGPAPSRPRVTETATPVITASGSCRRLAIVTLGLLVALYAAVPAAAAADYALGGV